MTRPIKPASTPAGRRRQIQRLVADALAPADPRPSATSQSTPDLAALVRAEVEAQRQRDRQAAEEAHEAAFRCPSGACWRCGLGEAEDFEGHPIPWFPDGDGRHLCPPCKQRDLSWSGLTPSERHLLDITLLLFGRAIWPMRDAGDFDAIPVLWSETEGAEPSLEAWAHVDVEALRQAYERVARSSTSETPPRPWPTRKGPKCPVCGGRDYLVTTGMPTSHWPVPEQPIQTHIERAEQSLCATCRRNWLAQAGGRVSA